MTTAQTSQALEAAELLRICQSNMGADKYDLSPDDRNFWERIDACRAELARPLEVAAVGITEDQITAGATLLAAAPRLLAALESLLGAITNVDQVTAVNDARAAVADAKGTS